MADRHIPDLDPILGQLLTAAPLHFDLAQDGVDAARARLRAMASAVGDQFPDVHGTDHTVATAGDEQLRLRVYRDARSPAPDNGSPLVFFCHGGGFALGDLDVYDSLCKRIAARSSAIVVSVDYRLAPEHPFPAAVDDAWAGLRWTVEHATALGGDVERIAVAGDSAGGNLAAVLTHLVREADAPPLRFQLLWYPTTTCDVTLPSMTENADAPLLDRAGIETFMNWYAPGIDLTNPPVTLAPAAADSFEGLPPAFIAIAGHDPLRDDGARYAQLLDDAGVPVQVHRADALIHGYAYFAGIIPAATQAVDDSLTALRAALLA